MKVVPRLELSRPQEVQLALTWTAILHGRVELDLAVTGGVHGAREVLKSMLAGARVVLMASRFFKDGPEMVVPEILTEVREWMQRRGYTSLRELQGKLDQPSVSDPGAFQRVNYMRTLYSYQAIPASQH